MALTAIIAYDIADNGRRSKVAALLQAHGDRVQKSVFMLTIHGADLESLTRRLAAVIDLNHDSIYTFRQCADCWDAVGVIGQAHPPSPVLFWAVW